MRNNFKPIENMLNKKAIYAIYLLMGKNLRSKYKPFKISAVEQITLTLIKLRYALSDRAIKALFSVDLETAL